MPDDPRPRFEELRRAFADVLASLETHDAPGLVREDWERRNEQLRRALLPLPPADFLRLPAIRDQMFVGEHHLAPELAMVRRLGGSVRDAAEDPVGDPPSVVVDGVVTSANSVHHLHHLLRFEAATGVPVGRLATIVEWGGGYGNLAKLVWRLHRRPVTYVVIDTPVFTALQWLYLSSVLGPDAVVVHDHAPVQPTTAAVHLVPLGLAADLELTADLFVSTWALNESPVRAQRLVLDRDCFGARHLLLGMHATDPLMAEIGGRGARTLPVTPTMAHQRYVVR